MIKALNTNLLELEGFQFHYIQELVPERDECGKIKEFMPQSRYDKSATTRLNAYGNGPFCRFSIHSKWAGYSGVYSLFSGNDLLYIGLCVDLYKRFNMGYGNISPRNCYEAGQATNCKINKMILTQYHNRNKVSLYFHRTDDYKLIESLLIRTLKPPYNGYGTIKTDSKLLQNVVAGCNEYSKDLMNCENMSDDLNPISEDWHKTIRAFSTTEIELHTQPKQRNRKPLWFAVYSDGNTIYVSRAKDHTPSSEISHPRRLTYSEFNKIYPIYLKRKTGSSVSREAAIISHNQVYWYAIMEYCGL